MIIGIRTDQPRAELYLLDQTGKQLDQAVWEAGRQLSKQILAKIKELLTKNQIDFDSLTGVVAFKGPGSFTGLRIGISVANALAYGQQIPVAGAGGKNWLKTGMASLAKLKVGEYVMPDYGAPPRISKPIK